MLRIIGNKEYEEIKSHFECSGQDQGAAWAISELSREGETELAKRLARGWGFRVPDDLSSVYQSDIEEILPLLTEQDWFAPEIKKQHREKSRTVKIFKLSKDDKGTFFKEFDGIGVFVHYGTDYEEFETGAANFTTAIVEMPDGTVKNISVNLIQFLK